MILLFLKKLLILSIFITFPVSAEVISEYTQGQKNNEDTFTQIEYDTYGRKVHNGYIMIVYSRTKHTYGLLNVKTKKFIQRAIHDEMYYTQGMFEGSINGAHVLLDHKGKKIIDESHRYDRFYISKYDSIVAEHTGENGFLDTYDFYDKKGIKYSSGIWNSRIGDFGKSKLLLVESWERVNKKEGSYCSTKRTGDKTYYKIKTAYVNVKGEIVIDASHYFDVSKFSNGMAAVCCRENNLWGFIDTKGKQVIPCVYNNTRHFQKKYAYVAKNNQAFLIDKYNNIVKTLPSIAKKIQIEVDNDNAIYFLKNGKNYNANGMLVDYSTHKSVPVVVGKVSEQTDACPAWGQVVGVDEKSEGFLSVRTGPGTKYRSKDKLHNGTGVFLCDMEGKWMSIVYGSNCGVSSPVPHPKKYTGPCKYGWVFEKYIELIAG